MVEGLELWRLRRSHDFTGHAVDFAGREQSNAGREVERRLFQSRHQQRIHGRRVDRSKCVLQESYAAGLQGSDGAGVNDPLKPSLSLLIKLGSIIVHQEEIMSPKGHNFDKAALDSVRNDPEVNEWFFQMNKKAFLPVKR